MASAVAPDAPLLGAKIRKSFGAHGVFEGVVEELWTRGTYEYAHIRYEDGDEEDLFAADARRLVVAPPA